MASIPAFNSNLDKITERELVPDIYSRIKVNCEILNDKENGFTNQENTLKYIDMQMLNSFPTFISDNIQVLRVARGNIYEDEYGCIVVVNSVKPSTDVTPVLIKAYLEKAGVDITDLVEQGLYMNRYLQWKFIADYKFINDDILRIYYYISEDLN